MAKAPAPQAVDEQPPQSLHPQLDPSTWTPSSNIDVNIAAYRRNLTAAVQPNSDVIVATPAATEPVHHQVVVDFGMGLETLAEVRRNIAVPLEASAIAVGRAEPSLTPTPITVVPTPYPQEPGAPLVVHGSRQIDPRSPELRDLNAKLDRIIDLLAGSNLFAIETREQLTAEIQAGKALVGAPKPNKELIKALLVSALVFIAGAAASTLMGDLAHEALHLIEELFQVPIPV